MTAGTIGAVRARAVVDAWCELYELPDVWSARRHFVERAMELTKADAGALTLLEGIQDADGTAYILHAAGFETRRERDVFVDDYQAVPDNPVLARLVTVTGEHVVRRRSDLLSDDEWYRHPFALGVHFKLLLDDSMWALTRQSGSSGLGLVLLRRASARSFTREDAAVLEALARKSTWLRGALRHTTAHLWRGLTPRQRETLDLLLCGCGEQESAVRMGVSPHTLHSYAKQLHRHFGVRSRGELAALFLAREP